MRVILRPTSPYDFALSAAIFSSGDEKIRKFENGKFWQVVRADEKLILVTVKSVGTIDKPQLEVELISNVKIGQKDEQKAAEIISWLLNINLDLKPFYSVAQNDKVLSGVTQKLKGLKSPITATPFEALVDSIIEQQISLRVAHSLQGNIIKSFGDSIKVNGEHFYAYPTPLRLSRASVEELRQCGLSLRKAEYIREISELISQGKLDLDKYKDCEDTQSAVREMDQLRGIGIWTAELTLVRGMGKLDAIPADDLGLRRVISHYYFNDRKILSEEARQIAMNWGRWKGLASFYLVMAEIKGIKL